MAALLALLTAPAGSPAQPPAIRGVSLTMTTSVPDFNYAPFLAEIAALGANSVSLVIPWYQENARSVEVSPLEGKTPSDEVLRRTIRQARDARLDVLLYPTLLLREGADEQWRGSIDPADRDAWFRSYTLRLTRLATLAEEEKVSHLCVGSEFSSLDHDAPRWRAACAAVRAVYTGRLIYNANWDVPDHVTWWDAVDYMGVSAYYELGNPGEDDADVDALAGEWGEWRAWLLQIRDRSAPGKPLVFCEVGYPSIDGGAVLPWDYGREAPVDLEEQRRAFEAFIRTWDGQADLAGCFVYTWHEFERDPACGYTPRGKPASEVIRAWYSAPSGADHH